MGGQYRVMAAAGCLLFSLCAGTQAGDARKIILPNPQLIHCHAANCSQLWKQDPGDVGAVYPSQVLTDLVNGEVVGLTAVYDKSVSTKELQAVLNTLYGKWALHGIQVWRVKPERIAISIADGEDGAKEVIYLKFGTYSDLMPTAHLSCCK